MHTLLLYSHNKDADKFIIPFLHRSYRHFIFHPNSCVVNELVRSFLGVGYFHRSECYLEQFIWFFDNTIEIFYELQREVKNF